MATILLVCTGNICRSPMAEAFIRHVLDERGVEGVRVESSGVSGWDGSPATPEAVDAVMEYGLDISGHQARRLTGTMLGPADLILAMASEHRDAVSRLAPQAARRAFTLKELVYLLEQSPVQPVAGSHRDQLRASVAAAADARDAGLGLELLDEDVSDPLGLGIESFRAVAWEVENLARRVVDGLFPGVAGASVRDDGGSIWGSRQEGDTP
jgi:protein-tyrosine phosphatase